MRPYSSREGEGDWQKTCVAQLSPSPVPSSRVVNLHLLRPRLAPHNATHELAADLGRDLRMRPEPDDVE